METLLIANRGEVALRILRAATEMGLRTVAVFSEDDAGLVHAARADEARALRGRGAAAYLDAEQILAAATAAGCDAIHPGYGFLSEHAAFARRCAAAGLAFVGPRAETLATLGDKVQARLLAERCGVPVLKGSAAAVGVDQARAFLASLGGGAMMIKAVAGGGGRGMRVVRDAAELEAAYARCRSEARAAFDNPDVYVEQRMPRARHVEVQVLGDRDGRVVALGERECSIQRRHQKLIEIAPCPSLAPEMRERLLAAALRMAAAVRLENAATFEFLVEADAEAAAGAAFAFIEANPRLQVEHPVTEAVLGLDLVRLQLELAAGRTLAELGLAPDGVPAPRGFALQLRINAEVVARDGSARPASGALSAVELPSGPGVRVDTGAQVGYRTSPHFDPLLAKVIVHSTSPRFADAVARARRALAELRLEGVRTNAGLLGRLLAHPDFVANRIHTEFVDEHLGELTFDGDGRRPPSPVRERVQGEGDAIDPAPPPHPAHPPSDRPHPSPLPHGGNYAGLDTDEATLLLRGYSEGSQPCRSRCGRSLFPCLCQPSSGWPNSFFWPNRTASCGGRPVP